MQGSSLEAWESGDRFLKRDKLATPYGLQGPLRAQGSPGRRRRQPAAKPAAGGVDSAW